MVAALADDLSVEVEHHEQLEFPQLELHRVAGGVCDICQTPICSYGVLNGVGYDLAAPCGAR